MNKRNTLKVIIGRDDNIACITCTLCTGLHYCMAVTGYTYDLSDTYNIKSLLAMLYNKYSIALYTYNYVAVETDCNDEQSIFAVNNNLEKYETDNFITIA